MFLGDVILGVNEHPIRRNEDLPAVLDLFELGQFVNLSVLRAARPVTISVQLTYDREEPAACHAKLLGYV